ncbi:hypothetical protein [Stieleria mannarensis]|uniref:hypothetical protein n=1 Tax=Stieleria mannarensis TaxID=2755585 RepID=UPI0016034BD0|nr:hypothetical protein [Rhodopirellula sp. JC639]
MQNPFRPPRWTIGTPADAPPSSSAGPNRTAFFAWYFAAFIVAEVMWRLSGYVRAIDLLELPLASFHFPLAGFVDPHDSMVRSEGTFFCAIVFWTAVIPVAFRIAPRKVGPLLTALAIIAFCAVAATVYTFLYHWLGLGQIAGVDFTT